MPDVVLVPGTAMGDRYLEVHAKTNKDRPWRRGERTRAQLELAERDRDDVKPLAEAFLDSIKEFSKYDPRDEPFHPKRKENALKKYEFHRGDESKRPSTSRFAAAIERPDMNGRQAGLKTSKELPNVGYVDRELVPSRTTSPSDFEHPKGTKVRLDLLLAAGSRPVVAEVKAGGDENVYYALIQGLANLAQLAPPKQRERLSKEYPQLADEGPMELWIVLAEHNSRGKDKKRMVMLSHEIAKDLLKESDVARYISAIRCVRAEIPESGPVPLDLEGDYSWSVEV